MDGVTDAATRYIYSKTCKPSVIYTEQVSVEAIVLAFEEIKDRLAFAEVERPIVAQLSGYDPKYYFEAAKKVIELGFDGIDINSGCPVKTCNKKGGVRGAGLIGERDTVKKIVNSCRNAIDQNSTKRQIALSIKTRLGVDKPITREWVSFLTSLPIDTLAVHGRTWKQGYRGKADWEEIGKAAQIAKSRGTILLGNGDVLCRQQAEEMSSKYGLDGVLIGRAARGNPWIFSPIPNHPTKQQRIDTLVEHAKYYESTRGDRPFIEFRKHIGWYLKGFSGAKELRSRLINVSSFEELSNSLFRSRSAQAQGKLESRIFKN